MRSFLKWAGSKFAIRNRILNHLPPGNRLIEPFGGSAVIFLNSQHYNSYLIAENNPDLIDIYQFLQKEGNDFIQDCRHYFKPENNHVDQYLLFRKLFNETLGVPERKRERAMLFIYLNRHGYNGLCRYNSSGLFNVPFGRYINPELRETNMLYFHHKSQNAIFKYADFRETFAMAKKGDVIYCDPPYVPLSKTAKFSEYVAKEFSASDQEELVKLAKKFAKKGIPVIISNHDTPVTRQYYEDAIITQLDVSRHISCNIKNRKKVSEIIAVFGMPETNNSSIIAK